MDLKECCAQQIDREAFAALLDEYAAQMPKFRNKEIYKWQAIQHFQQTWNPDSEDFPAMLEDAFSKCDILLTNGMWFALGMLTELVKAEPEVFKSAFVSTLYDERIPLFDRLGAFSSIATEALERENNRRADQGLDPAKSHYQDSRAMSVYLACRYPGEYPLYKASMYKALAKELNFEVPGNKFEKVSACKALYEQMVALIQELRPELIGASDALLGEELAALDSAHLLLAQDIAYYVEYWREELKSNDPTKLSSAEIEEMFIEWVKPLVKSDGYPYDLAKGLANRRGDKYNVRELLPSYENAFDCRDSAIIDAAYKRALDPASGVSNFKGWRSAALSKYKEFLEFLKYEQDKPQTQCVQYWVYAPGEGACAWSDCVEQGIMVLGWDDLGDFADYESREQMTERMNELWGESSHANSTLACWDFEHTMQVGDVVYAKRGLNVVLGRGIVTSDATYDSSRESYQHVRSVDWREIGEWDATSIPLPQKTLTQWTSPDDVAKLAALFKTSVGSNSANPPYTDDDFLEEVYMDEPALLDMKALLRRKKNLILQGSPGTGKTFAAKRLAWCMMGEQDNSRIQMVQFHQSSTYDDFVVGYRPKEEGGFRIAEGTFVKFCRKAAADPARDYFFIIDEINRANISKVFGELLMLIEADHRGDEITLSVGDIPFSVPKNIYLIGMMNTADRGLALIDYALRRRFAFFEMEPALRHDLFIQRVETVGDPHMKQFIKAVDLLNKVIAEDEALGRGFRIGHSYFCDTGTEESTGEGTAESVLKYEIEPLVEEYWFDDQDKAEVEIKKLRDSLQ